MAGTKADFLTSFGATTAVGATKDFTAAATDICTAAGHGKQTGFGPVRLTNSGGALPAGLAGSTDYWMIVIDANTFKLATSEANALAGTAVDITGAGTGTHSMRATGTTLADALEDLLNNVLVHAGNRVNPPADNVFKFWSDAVVGVGF